MQINQLSGRIVDICIRVHRGLGPGLFESVYEEILCYELKKEQIDYERQVPVRTYWNGVKMDIGFRADIIVEEKIIVEIKSIEQLAPVHYKQLLTYLKLTDIKLGLLINFNEALLKNGIRRVVNNL
ncbi:MAG: GxxExxY protein [Balneolaceae bacterium]